MKHHESYYQEAQSNLLYIEKIKQEICMLLDWLTDVRNSKMYISAQDFDHACATLGETIDDLFFEEIRNAKNVMDGDGDE